MRARTWPATLRPQRKGHWDASDRARQQIARHAAEDGPMWPMELHQLELIGRLFADFESGLGKLQIAPAECHGWEPRAYVPVTSEELPDGGICARCGTDVLI